MATAIHHGGGVGTYKTFSVIQRHAIPQLKSGRHIISTIRGFDSIRVIEAVLEIDIPETSSIEFVDLETTEGIEKIRRWWEWAPKGAYIIIDEAQLIYPKGKRVSTYDYPARDGMTSEQTAQLDGKPTGFLQAFTMQRHNNWDLAIITPNIKMLLPEIREVTQVAYEHKYMGALLPWAKHGWREIQHAPLEMGKGSPHPPVRYTADKRIYKTYKSTKTGSHSSANAERSIFQNPKVINTILFIVLAISVFLWIVFTRIIGRHDVKDNQESRVSPVQVHPQPAVDNGSNSNVFEASRSRNDIKSKAIETTKFDSPVMAIVGKFFDEYTIEVGVPPNATQFTTGYLHRNGVELKIISDCFIEMTFNEVKYNVRCPLHHREFESKNDVQQVQVKPLMALGGA